MNFHRNKKPNTKTITILIFTAVILLLVFVSGLRNSLSSGIINVGQVFWNAKNNFFYKISGDQIDSNLIKTLEIENKLLKEENTRLKKITSSQPRDEDIILSAVLSRPPHSPYDTFVIEGGRDVGVSVGDVVFVDNLIAVGVVQEVLEDVSKVTLFSSFNLKTRVLVGENAVSLTALGKGGQNFIIEVPQGVSFEKGDLAFLPGIDSAVVGEIDQIRITEGETTQTLFLRSPVNLQELQFVLIVKQ